MKSKFGKDRMVGTIEEMGEWLCGQIEAWTPEQKAEARAELDRALPRKTSEDEWVN